MNHLKFFKNISVILIAVVASLVAMSVHADWPEKSIKIVIGYAPGGGTDIVARIIAPKVSEILKGPVVIENRPGAAGMIAEGFVAKATPDGYTVLMDPIGIVMTPSLYKKVPYDAIKDFQPVAQIFAQQFVIVVNPELPVKDLSELVALMRSKPKEVNIAVAGTSTQLAAEMFRLKLGLTATLIPYKGSAPASTSVITGETQVMFADLPSVKPHLTSGRIKVLAVMGNKPALGLPNVRPASETGVFNGNVSSWTGVFAPAATPLSIVNTLNAAINRVLKMPEVAAQLVNVGVEPTPISPEEFTVFYRNEVAAWRDVVNQAKIPLSD